MNLVQLNLAPLLTWECHSCFVSGCFTAFLTHFSLFIAFPFPAVLWFFFPLSSCLFVLNRMFWLVNLSCLLLDVTLLATCSLFSGPRHLALLIYIFMSAPNHFAPVVFKAAVGVAGDKEVHLPRQEQPEGTSWNHQLHSRVWWGLKPQRGGIIFFL